MGNYRRGDNLPDLVQNALHEGYKIAHIGLICWISLPPVSLQPTIRVLFIALEAAFSYIFWAMRTVNKDYGMSSICLWDRTTLEYDGCCSHCCLNEMITGDFTLSAE